MDDPTANIIAELVAQSPMLGAIGLLLFRLIPQLVRLVQLQQQFVDRMDRIIVRLDRVEGDLEGNSKAIERCGNKLAAIEASIRRWG